MGGELLSTQENYLRAIADAIREKDATTQPIPAQDFAARILAIPAGGGGSDYAIPLVVDAEPGTTVTAALGDTVLTAVADENGTATVILTAPGEWEIFATLEDKEKGPFPINALESYRLDIGSRVPAGYTEVEYISNPNLGYSNNLPPIDNPILNARIELEISNVTGLGIYIWGTDYYVASGANYQHLMTSVNTKNRIGFAYGTPAKEVFINATNLEERTSIVIDYPNRLFSVNGIEAGFAAFGDYKYTALAPVLFGRKYTTQTSSTVSGKSNFNFHEMKVYQANTENLLFHYIPCVGPDGIAGIYDLVNNNFMKSSDSTKHFVAGPKV